MSLNRKIQPGTQLLADIPEIKPEELRLDNNLQVYLLHAGNQELVKIDFLFDAGNWYQPQALISSFTSSMLKEGSRNYTAAEIAAQIDFYGAHLQTHHDKDMAIVSLYTLNKYLDRVLPIIGDVILHPTFPEEELRVLKQSRKQKFVVNSEKVRYLAKKNFSTLIFGREHPYGRPINIEAFDALQREQLIEFHRRNFSLANCKIIVSGKIPNNLPRLLQNVFGNQGIDPVTKSVTEIREPASLNGRVNFIRKENAVQSSFRVGKVMFNKKHPDYFGFKILNTILGGYFGSRLMSNIREDKGYTYGIGSALVSMHNSGFFFITSETGSDVTQDALKEVYLEIERLQQDLVPEHELLLVKNYMFGSLMRAMDGAFARSDVFRGLIEYGLNDDFYRKYVEIIRSISPAEIRGLAQTWLQKESLIELTVGS